MVFYLFQCPAYYTCAFLRVSVRVFVAVLEEGRGMHAQVTKLPCIPIFAVLWAVQADVGGHVIQRVGCSHWQRPSNCEFGKTSTPRGTQTQEKTCTCATSASDTRCIPFNTMSNCTSVCDIQYLLRILCSTLLRGSWKSIQKKCKVQVLKFN